MRRSLSRVFRELLLVVFAAGGLVAATGSWREDAGAAADEPPRKELPPLIVDTQSPLLLDAGAKKDAHGGEVSASVAENTACFVCHENYRTEPLVQWHADGGVGCVDCHGKSFAHRNDENNTTPPDIMFPRGQIDMSCEECHDAHDVPAADVVARLRQRVPLSRSDELVVCTECHGRHRLDHRTVVWDRETRKLLTGSHESPKSAGPTFETLKSLAGSWVIRGPNGQPTDEVVSTFHVAAAGNAVVEHLLPGTDQEVMSVYHQADGALLLTHYSATNNQPRMKCVSGGDAETLCFQYIDGTNIRSPDEPHMRKASLKILGRDRIQMLWQRYEHGHPDGQLSFDLVRAQ